MRLFGAASGLRAFNLRTHKYDRTIGLGLFTMKCIGNMEIISIFNGYYFPSSAMQDHQLRNGCLIFINDDVMLDCYSTRGWMCMASLSNSATNCWNMVTNRKAECNAYIHIDERSEVTLRALRDLEPGEEVVCNYGRGYIYPTMTDNVSSLEEEVSDNDESQSS
jgi:hypothetical protein